MTLGLRIVTTRESLQMTQAQLATALGVTRQYISALEQDKRSPSLSFLVKLAAALRVTLDYLVIGKEEICDSILAIYADRTLKLESREAIAALIRELRERGA